MCVYIIRNFYGPFGYQIHIPHCKNVRLILSILQIDKKEKDPNRIFSYKRREFDE